MTFEEVGRPPGGSRASSLLWSVLSALVCKGAAGEVCSRWQRLADRTVDRQFSLVAMEEAEERRRLTQAEAEESLAALADAHMSLLRGVEMTQVTFP